MAFTLFQAMVTPYGVGLSFPSVLKVAGASRRGSHCGFRPGGRQARKLNSEVLARDRPKPTTPMGLRLQSRFSGRSISCRMPSSTSGLTNPDPIRLFQNSPVRWDEVIAIPLPYLDRWLTRMVECDRERGLEQLRFVAARRPYQRKAAQRALLAIVIQELHSIGSIPQFAAAAGTLSFIPTESSERTVPEGVAEAIRRIRRISELAAEQRMRVTPVGQARVLGELSVEIESFRNAMALASPAGRNRFRAYCRGLGRVRREGTGGVRKANRFRADSQSIYSRKPASASRPGFVQGTKGHHRGAGGQHRQSGPQAGVLLLYGRRRIGKTSTLLNLPRLLSSRFIPVFMDCQNAKWQDGEAAFCYHLFADVTRELDGRGLLSGVGRLRMEEFENHPFTRLEEHPDRIEDVSRKAGKQVLLSPRAAPFRRRSTRQVC